MLRQAPARLNKPPPRARQRRSAGRITHTNDGILRQLSGPLLMSRHHRAGGRDDVEHGAAVRALRDHRKLALSGLIRPEDHRRGGVIPGPRRLEIERFCSRPRRPDHPRILFLQDDDAHHRLALIWSSEISISRSRTTL
ncbi:hypothetical protein RPD_2151 [Rhodopseudomonas palustris BisB5]|uniref:Uncharacterized protein n=1 Tax=Rhodopseudomonas palustris (strain BisB5) TaxID=316057 RepID=Q138V3_RHOPS|nr:hypothetical protein RPD_2151 [Rhodopseudomonas palustris BisB5]